MTINEARWCEYCGNALTCAVCGRDDSLPPQPPIYVTAEDGGRYRVVGPTTHRQLAAGSPFMLPGKWEIYTCQPIHPEQNQRLAAQGGLTALMAQMLIDTPVIALEKEESDG